MITANPHSSLKQALHAVRLLLVLLTLLCGLLPTRVRAEETRRVSLLVEVLAVGLDGRSADQSVAALAVNFEELVKKCGWSGSVRLDSIRVQEIDPQTGKAVKFKGAIEGENVEGGDLYNRPCRFDDDSLPDPYPDRLGHASETVDGRPNIVWRTRGARLFNREVLPKSGRLVWVHTQRGQTATRYAVSFALQDKLEWQVPPAPWIGDGDPLRRASGPRLGEGFSHFKVTAADLDGDGLFDLVAGTEKGDLMWFPNHGKPGKPEFTGSRMLLDEQGPIDTGWYAVPFIYDWDGDGKPDLLVGTSANVILWWKNIGAAQSPQFSYRGFVQADGRRLEVPQGPVAEDQANIFKTDYYNQPWVGDWDGDGVPDILTGSYVTGQISFYRGVGRNADGTPALHYEGPLQADGKVLDTVWAAAPFAYDFDGDGKKDLITGSWFWSGIHRPREAGEADYLMYYHQAGTGGLTGLHRERLPRIGEFPRGLIARPTVVDWNNDGLPDLLVSDDGQVRVFLNTGTDKQPCWTMTSQPLRIPWGFASDVDLSAPSILPRGHDHPLFVQGASFNEVRGSLADPRYLSLGRATVHGQAIVHPGPGYGDPYSYTTLCDWDGDGLADLLWGTQQGNIYLHRGRPGKKPFDFEEGVLLKLSSGEALRVGPPVMDAPEKAKDFTILQGSRITFAAMDFDGDGVLDLIVTDTYGKVWFFRNTRTGGTDTLEPPVQLAKLPTRTTSVLSMDWNHDGKPDLLTEGTAAAPGMLLLNASHEGHAELSKPSRPFDLPFMFWNPKFGAIDWNKDGDGDLMVRSESYMFFVEQSFLAHGYRPAVLLNISASVGEPGGH